MANEKEDFGDYVHDDMERPEMITAPDLPFILEPVMPPASDDKETK